MNKIMNLLTKANEQYLEQN